MSRVRTLLHDDPNVLDEATAALDDRALVVLPTDTLYALAADALDEDAVLEVFRAKGRASDQALPVCVSGVEDVGNVGTMTPLARKLAERWWPGPLTLILRAKPWVPDAVTGGGETVAVRAPAHAFARALASHFGPYTLTSANRSGRPAPADVAAAREELGGAVRLYVDGGSVGGVPSTLVDATGATPRVLREGAVPATEVAALGR